MPHYTVGKRWRFDELGRKAGPDEDIELTEEQAEAYLKNEPGLLKPVRRTTQAHPEASRDESAHTEHPAKSKPKTHK
jgi:hypothetical protein